MPGTINFATYTRSTASATPRPGGYVYDYFNAIHLRVVADDGRPKYDGHIVAVAGRAARAVPMAFSSVPVVANALRLPRVH